MYQIPPNPWAELPLSYLQVCMGGAWTYCATSIVAWANFVALGVWQVFGAVA